LSLGERRRVVGRVIFKRSFFRVVLVGVVVVVGVFHFQTDLMNIGTREKEKI
jgi:hypothetical protein